MESKGLIFRHRVCQWICQQTAQAGYHKLYYRYVEWYLLQCGDNFKADMGKLMYNQPITPANSEDINCVRDNDNPVSTFMLDLQMPVAVAQAGYLETYGMTVTAAGSTTKWTSLVQL